MRLSKVELVRLDQCLSREIRQTILVMVKGTIQLYVLKPPQQNNIRWPYVELFRLLMVQIRTAEAQGTHQVLVLGKEPRLAAVVRQVKAKPGVRPL